MIKIRATDILPLSTLVTRSVLRQYVDDDPSRKKKGKHPSVYTTVSAYDKTRYHPFLHIRSIHCCVLLLQLESRERERTHRQKGKRKVNPLIRDQVSD